MKVYTCVECQVNKSAESFYLDSQTQRPRSRCKVCLLAYNKRTRDPIKKKLYEKSRGSGSSRQTRQARRDGDLRRKYTLTQGQYDTLSVAQNALCAICHLPETIVRHGRLSTLAVDHDHNTGAIRGLLCNRCNLLLGKSADSPVLLRAAAAYLER